MKSINKRIDFLTARDCGGWIFRTQCSELSRAGAKVEKFRLVAPVALAPALHPD
jgi:hypothetical protein